MIAQVDEQQAAVVAHAVHPARQADGRAHVPAAQRPASVERCDAVPPGAPRPWRPCAPPLFFTSTMTRRLLKFLFRWKRGKAHGVLH